MGGQPEKTGGEFTKLLEFSACTVLRACARGYLVWKLSGLSRAAAGTARSTPATLTALPSHLPMQQKQRALNKLWADVEAKRKALAAQQQVR